jgi:hypothetical protein
MDKGHKALVEWHNTCWFSSEDGLAQGEITCECGRNYIGEIGRRLGKRSKKKKYNLKEQHFDESKSVLHACEEGHKSDWTRTSNVRFQPSATYSKYKWLTCYVPAILLVTPVWRYLLFGLVPFGRERTQMRLNSRLLFFLCYVFLCVWFYLHELSVLVVLYFTIFVFTESYLYFIIWYRLVDLF